jgi:predicted transcriptional regulator
MNKMAESILERIADWPDEARAKLAQSIMDIEEQYVGVCRLSDEERAAVLEGLAQADRGEFVPDEVVEEFFKRRIG